MFCDGYVTIARPAIRLTKTQSQFAAAGNGRLARTIVVSGGAMLAVVALNGFEFLMWSMPVLPNQAPGADLYSYGRSGLVALLSLAIVAIAAAPHAASTPRPALSVRQSLIATVSLLLLLAFLAVFLVSPQTFSAMSLEDGMVEWTSALLPIGGSILLFWCGLNLLVEAWGKKDISWAGAAIILCAGLLFSLGMEEISWMQRIFGFSTPEGMRGNIQGEFNLHNLATNQIGVLHKFFGFGFLIFLPFIYEFMPRAQFLTALVPSRCVALVSAPLAALNYNGWDFLPMQMTTYLTIGILLHFALRAWREQQFAEMMIAAAMAVAIIGAQAAFLAHGDRFVRIWEITEYKELYIALGLFVWAAETFKHLRAGRVLPEMITAFQDIGKTQNL